MRKAQGRRTPPEKHPPGRRQGDQKQQLYLRDHLNPSVSYCPVTRSQGIVNKLNIQIKTKFQRTGYLFSLPLPRCQREGLDVWAQQGASGPGLGLGLEILSHSLLFVWKPSHGGGGRGGVLELGCRTHQYGRSTPALGLGFQPRGRSLGAEDVSYKQKCSIKSTSLNVNYKILEL